MTNGDPKADPAGPADPHAPRPGARAALVLLLAINLFNYIDRQILSATLPKIELDATIFHPDAAWKQTKLGLLATAFMVSYMLLAPPFGWLGDRYRRWALVGVGVILWSLATGGTGLAVGYWLLLLTRCLVGVGEAAYGPVAPAMLSDLYPVERRGRIMAWFYLAIPIGSALGFVIGGQVAETALGWRGAFLLAVVPGLVLGAICFFMREPPRTEHRHHERTDYRAVLKELWGIRSFVLCCAGMTASTFILGGVAHWIPKYIFEREARFTLTPESVGKLRGENFRRSDGTFVVPDEAQARLLPAEPVVGLTADQLKAHLRAVLTADELPQYQAAVFTAVTADGSMTTGTISQTFGAILVVAGLLATMIGGVTGDWLRNRGVKGAYLRVTAWSTLVGFPCFLGILYAPFPLAWVMVFATLFAMFFNTGPANTVLANVVRSPIRASAFAVNILVIHAFGDAISPALIGLIADVSSLHTAFFATSFLILLAGGLWLFGSEFLDDDTRRAEQA